MERMFVKLFVLFSKLFLIFLLDFVSLKTTNAAIPISLPNCKSNCGNISIPYPFGIGKDCYKNAWYELLCNQTSNNQSFAFLKSVQRQVTEITLPGGFMGAGHLLIKSPIVSSGCSSSGRVGEDDPPVNLTGSPFFFSASNRFVVSGCNNKGLMTNISPQIVGCVSTCGQRSSNPKTKGCDGDRCCETTLPTNIQVFGANVEKADSSINGSSGCQAAFITSEELSRARMSDTVSLVAKQYVQVHLDWYMDTVIKSSSSLSSRCQTMFSSFFNYSYCYCAEGFEGNPYLQNGCQDIDACGVGGIGHSVCIAINATCLNGPGSSFTCDAEPSNQLIVLVIAVLGFALLIIVLVLWGCIKSIKKIIKTKQKKKFFKRNGGLLLQQQVSSTEGNAEHTKLYRSIELEIATDKFNVNRILGQGGQGTVYKGMLVDGRIVAVKKSKKIDEDQLEEFVNEVRILSQINHRNVVKLMGCCLETEVPLLVYEFIPNGDLYRYIHDQTDDFPMTWETRLRIAIEVAGALAYLHSAATTPILHRDIKSLNILLDEKYRAKIADFGSSRNITIDQTHLTTKVQGTFGYLDPEYYQSSQFTEKSDVYSFGVVLVELITGEKPISFQNTGEGRVLVTYFVEKMKENRVLEIVDSRIKEESDIQDQIMEVSNLARRCLYLNGRKRPSMTEVAISLERIRSRQTLNFEAEDSPESEDMEAEGIANSWAILSSTSFDETTSSLLQVK